MDRIMLHSPTFAAAWNDFLRVVIGDLSLSERESQFVMCVVGILNGADYETFSHAPRYLAAGGTQEQLDALSDFGTAVHDTRLFDERERAILRFTEEMTLNVAPSEDSFALVRTILGSDEMLVDLVGLISTYNMVSRFVVAFDIRADDGVL